MTRIATALRSPEPVPGKILIRQAQAILLDWDGCVAIDNRIIPGALDFIARYRDRIAILTNNSSDLPEDIGRLLAAKGIALSSDRIVTAGAEAVRWARAGGHGRTMLLGSRRMQGFAREQGLELVTEGADLVLLMRDTRFTYRQLERAMNMVLQGARLMVANADRTHPGVGDRIVPETGALLAAILAGVPDARPVMIGKPAPMLFERACAVLGVSPCAAVMVGDNPETDIAGARAMGMASVLIGGPDYTSLGDLVA